eukprot:12938719-Prorocentrum_lima.AAC.1
MLQPGKPSGRKPSFEFCYTEAVVLDNGLLQAVVRPRRKRVRLKWCEQVILMEVSETHEQEDTWDEDLLEALGQ